MDKQLPPCYQCDYAEICKLGIAVLSNYFKGYAVEFICPYFGITITIPEKQEIVS